MRTRAILALVAVTAILQAAPASACAKFQYQPAVAEARMRGTDGVWRPLHIEVGGSRMRLEYDSTRSASGRVGMVFEVESNAALVFPTPGARTPPRQAEVVIPVTLDAALAGLGLSRRILARTTSPALPRQKVGQISCTAAWDFDLQREDRSICLASARRDPYGGLPAYALDGQGRRIFEMTAVTYRPVPDARLRPPPRFRIAGVEDTRSGCGGR